MGNEQEGLRVFPWPGLPKLNFQVLRRAIATLAQKTGSLEGVQRVLRHDKIETTGNVYMQEIERSVQRTMNSIHKELRVSRSWSERDESHDFARGPVSDRP